MLCETRRWEKGDEISDRDDDDGVFLFLLGKLGFTLSRHGNDHYYTTPP